MQRTPTVVTLALSGYGWVITSMRNTNDGLHRVWTPLYFMYDAMCSTTFLWWTINAPAAFAWYTINSPVAFAWCTNHFAHKVKFSYIGWNGVHPRWFSSTWSYGMGEWLHPTETNTWWRHQMETFSALLAICAGNSPVPGEFPTQRPVTRSFDVFFDLHLNKRLSKQSWGWWFETPPCPLWRHSNATWLLNPGLICSLIWLAKFRNFTQLEKIFGKRLVKYLYKEELWSAIVAHDTNRSFDHSVSYKFTEAEWRIYESVN